MSGSPALAMLQDLPPGEGIPPFVGWILIASACLDLVLAYFMAFVKTNPNPRLRWVFPGALVVGALLMAGLGVAFLTGAIGS